MDYKNLKHERKYFNESSFIIIIIILLSSRWLG